MNDTFSQGEAVRRPFDVHGNIHVFVVFLATSAKFDCHKLWIHREFLSFDFFVKRIIWKREVLPDVTRCIFFSYLTGKPEMNVEFD